MPEMMTYEQFKLKFLQTFYCDVEEVPNWYLGIHEDVEPFDVGYDCYFGCFKESSPRKKVLELIYNLHNLQLFMTLEQFEDTRDNIINYELYKTEKYYEVLTEYWEKHWNGILPDSRFVQVDDGDERELRYEWRGEDDSCDCCAKGWTKSNEFGSCECLCSKCGDDYSECKGSCS